MSVYRIIELSYTTHKEVRYMKKKYIIAIIVPLLISVMLLSSPDRDLISASSDGEDAGWLSSIKLIESNGQML